MRTRPIPFRADLFHLGIYLRPHFCGGLNTLTVNIRPKVQASTVWTLFLRKMGRSWDSKRETARWLYAQRNLFAMNKFPLTFHDRASCGSGGRSE